LDVVAELKLVDAVTAAFRFLGKVWLGWAAKEDVPGTDAADEFAFTVLQPLPADAARFGCGWGDCRDDEAAGGLRDFDRSRLSFTAGLTGISKSISTSSA
jgi:hypothetical protein